MKPDPGLPNLTPEEHLELDRLRNRYNELMTISTLEEAAKARDELQRVQARIRELTEKGGRPQIRSDAPGAPSAPRHSVATEQAGLGGREARPRAASTPPRGELPAAALELDRLGVARGFSPRREEIWRSLS